MRSLFSSSGTVSVSGRQASEVLVQVTNALREKHAADLHATNDALRFRGSLASFFSSWSILQPISSGEIQFIQDGDTVTARYRVSWLAQFIIFTGVASIAIVFSHDSRATVLLPLAWIFLFWITYTRVRAFRDFLAHAAGATPNKPLLGDPFPDY